METGCVVTGRAYDIAAVFDGRESICRSFGLFGACDRVIAFRDGSVARDDGGLCGGLSAFECDLGGAAIGGARGEQEDGGGEDEDCCD